MIATRPMLLALLLPLGGCAAAPAFEQLPATSAPAPYAVMEQPERWLDQPVVWGGMILDVKNFDRYSEIELLAYPLDDRQQPMLERADEGRFIAIVPGYTEAEDFAPGRFVSLIGDITGGREAPLRNETYYWPEVSVARLKIWPRDFRVDRRRFSIGIGISGGVDL